ASASVAAGRRDHGSRDARRGRTGQEDGGRRRDRETGSAHALSARAQAAGHPLMNAPAGTLPPVADLRYDTDRAGPARTPLAPRDPPGHRSRRRRHAGVRPVVAAADRSAGAAATPPSALAQD